MKVWDFVLVIHCVEAAVLMLGGHHSSVRNMGTQQPALALAQAEGLSATGAGSRAQAGGSRPRGHSGRRVSKERELTPVSDGSTGGPCWRHGQESTEDSKSGIGGESNQLPPSHSLSSFFIEGQDNCWHQTFISILNIAVLTPAAGLHGEGIQCLTDSSWSNT